MGKNTA